MNDTSHLMVLVANDPITKEPLGRKSIGVKELKSSCSMKKFSFAEAASSRIESSSPHDPVYRNSHQRKHVGVIGERHSLSQNSRSPSRSFTDSEKKYRSKSFSRPSISSLQQQCRRLYITDVDKNANLETIEAAFNAFGQCHVSMSLDDDRDVQKGFVVYKTVKGVKTALAKKKSIKISGKTVFVTQARSTCTQLFVGGYDIYNTGEQLTEFFSQYGEVARLDMKRTPDGTSRCFGFITFRDSPDAVELLTKIRFVECLDKIVEVTLAKPKVRSSTSLGLPRSNSTWTCSVSEFAPESPAKSKRDVASRFADSRASSSVAASRFSDSRLSSNLLLSANRFSDSRSSANSTAPAEYFRASSRSSGSVDSRIPETSMFKKAYFAPVRKNLIQHA